MTSSMQKIMNLMNKDVAPPKKSMELNKDHELVRNLIKIYKNSAKDKYLEQITEQLYESALLLEGYLTDPHKMVNRIQDILEKSTTWYLKK